MSKCSIFYKCRLCGSIFEGFFLEDIDTTKARNLLGGIIQGNEVVIDPSTGKYIPSKMSHVCLSKNSKLGVAEFCGIEVK